MFVRKHQDNIKWLMKRGQKENFNQILNISKPKCVFRITVQYKNANIANLVLGVPLGIDSQ